jgi:EAL domain-containing protein (putative c-di-GMP-specific phosphodiesterase class I)
MTRPTLTVHQRDIAARERLLGQVREIVVRQRYGVEYQPIVCARSGDITAYEALARFYTADGEQLAPLAVFEAMHLEPILLRHAECDLKQLQMDHAPVGYDLFLNLDPHALAAANGKAPALLERLIRTPGVVVELIENTDIHDARAALELHRMLSDHQVRTALDDIGAPHALLSLDLISVVDFLKFDRSWFGRLEHDHGQLMFRSMLGFSREAGRQTVLEGVENDNMLALARQHGIDRVQGFHYRPLFQAIAP